LRVEGFKSRCITAVFEISAFEGGCIGIEMGRGAQVPRRDAIAQRKPVADMTIDKNRPGSMETFRPP